MRINQDQDMTQIHDTPVKPQLFFDISEALHFAHIENMYSGIQRVVTSIIAAVSETDDQGRSFIYYIDQKSSEARCVPLKELPAAVVLDPSKLAETLLGGRNRASKLRPLNKYQDNPLHYYYHMLRLDIFAALGFEHSLAKHGTSAKHWKQLRAGAAGTAARAQTSVTTLRMSDIAKSGDFLICLDASWTPRHIEAFKAAKNNGLRLVSLVHDLIPLIAPSTVAEGTITQFSQWIKETTSFTSVYLANSRSTANDLRDYLEVDGHDFNVHSVPLAQGKVLAPAQDTTPVEETTNFVPRAKYPMAYDCAALDAPLAGLTAYPYVLCTGTIEARKNNWRLLLAWKSLIDKGYYDLPRLVFAGRRGWQSDQFWDLMKASGNLDGYATFINRPSDSELEYLYKNCLFTAMPSVYEGWGLPIGESLGYGKTAVVSETSSMPEVGLDLVEYCDPHSVESIAAAVEKLLDETHRKALEAKIQTTTLRSWSDVAQDLLAALDKS